MDSSRDVDLSLNYYEILGINTTANDVEIRKAYQKKALKLHPDKTRHLDAGARAAASEEFHRVQTGYELLMDTQARAALDAVLGARVRQQQRRSAMSAKRKQFQDDLDRREALAAQNKELEKAESILRAHLDRIRRENVKRMEREAANKAETRAIPPTNRGPADAFGIGGVKMATPFSQDYSTLEDYERVVFAKMIGNAE